MGIELIESGAGIGVSGQRWAVAAEPLMYEDEDEDEEFLDDDFAGEGELGEEDDDFLEDDEEGVEGGDDFDDEDDDDDL